MLSTQQPLELAFCEGGVVSDLIERVRLGHRAVMKHGLQEVCAVPFQVPLALLQCDKPSAWGPVKGQSAFLGPLVGVRHWVLEHILNGPLMCLHTRHNFLQRVDVNAIALYDSDVRRQNLIPFGVFHRGKLFTQYLQNCQNSLEGVP